MTVTKTSLEKASFSVSSSLWLDDLNESSTTRYLALVESNILEHSNGWFRRQCPLCHVEYTPKKMKAHALTHWTRKINVGNHVLLLCKCSKTEPSHYHCPKGCMGLYYDQQSIIDCDCNQTLAISENWVGDAEIDSFANPIDTVNDQVQLQSALLNESNASNVYDTIETQASIIRAQFPPPTKRFSCICSKTFDRIERRDRHSLSCESAGGSPRIQSRVPGVLVTDKVSFMRINKSGPDHRVHVTIDEENSRFDCSNAVCISVDCGRIFNGRFRLCRHVQSARELMENWSDSTESLNNFNFSPTCPLIPRLNVTSQSIENVMRLHQQCTSLKIPFVIEASESPKSLRNFSIFMTENGQRCYVKMFERVWSCSSCAVGSCVHVIAARWASLQNPASMENDASEAFEALKREVSLRYSRYILENKSIAPPIPLVQGRYPLYPRVVSDLTGCVLPGYTAAFTPSEINCPLCSRTLSSGRSVHTALLLCVSAFTRVKCLIKTCSHCHLDVHYKESSGSIYNHDSNLLLSHSLLESWRIGIHSGRVNFSDCFNLYKDQVLSGVPLSQDLVRKAFGCFEALRCGDVCMQCIICGPNPDRLIGDGNHKLRISYDPLIDLLPTPDNFSGLLTKAEFIKLSSDMLSERIARSTINFPRYKLSYALNVPIMDAQVMADSISLSEYLKENFEIDLAAGGPRPVREDELPALLLDCTNEKLKSFCRNANITFSANPSNSDLISKIREAVASFYVREENQAVSDGEVEMLKFFSRFNGTTGGIFTLVCPHLVCYYAKLLIRSEGNRDAFDALFAIQKLPKLFAYDNAQNFANHARVRLGNEEFKRCFGPDGGRVVPFSSNNILLARRSISTMVPMINDLPTDHSLILYDRLHEGNSKKESALLRRMDLVQDLRTTDSIAAEKLNKLLLKLTHSFNMMHPNNFHLSLRFFLTDWNSRKNYRLSRTIRTISPSISPPNSLPSLDISLESDQECSDADD